MSFNLYSLWRDEIGYLYKSAGAHLFEADKVYLRMKHSIDGILLLQKAIILGLMIAAFACIASSVFTFAVTIAYILGGQEFIPQSWKSRTICKKMVGFNSCFQLFFLKNEFSLATFLIIHDFSSQWCDY